MAAHSGNVVRAVALALCGSSLLAQGGWSNPTPSGLSPPVRGYHALAYDLIRGRTVVFGGWDGSTLVDTWEWDGTAWLQATPAISPPARCCHDLAFDVNRSVVVLFGGGGDPTAGTDLNDTWEYDGTNWLQAQPATLPMARRAHSLAFDLVNGAVLLFGGGLTSTGSPVLNDTWTWDGANWTLHNPATSPSPRWATCLATDWGNGTVMMFGGAVGAQTASFAETWTWDGADWQLHNPTTSPPGQRSSGGDYDLRLGGIVMFGGHLPFDPDTWIWNGTDWRVDTRAPRPAPRAAFSMAHDVLRGTTVLFGGLTGSYVNETWEYDSTGLAMVTPNGNGCAGPQGTPVLARAPGSLPIVGTTFSYELTYGAGSALAVFVLGLSDQTWIGGTLPQNMTGFGLPGCSLRASPDAAVFSTLANGTANLQWALPNDPNLMGVRVFAQSFVGAPSANPAGAVMSNGAQVTVGTF